ncbi:antitermination protein [Enterobacter hormaechei]|nr:antitermination protein [Enterobacter hormaechei]
MKIETISRYFSPATPAPDAMPRPSSPDRMRREDVLAALAFSSRECRTGLLLHLVRAGVLAPTEALESLCRVAEAERVTCPPLMKLPAVQRRTALNVLCVCAIEDYARSAASRPLCRSCDGSGFTQAEVFTNRVHCRPGGRPGSRVNDGGVSHEVWREVREQVRVCCRACGGKGVRPRGCRCRGRGEVPDRKETLRQGVPVMKPCGQCHGQGYTRMAFSVVLRRLAPVWSPGKTVAYRDVRPFFDWLVSRCHQEEAHAERVLRRMMF